MSDTINRQEAIHTALEFFVEFLGGAFHEDAQKILVKRMNELPSAERVEKWIPVTERLPEIKEHFVSDYVLVSTKDGEVFQDRLEATFFGEGVFSCERIYPNGESYHEVQHGCHYPRLMREQNEKAYRYNGHKRCDTEQLVACVGRQERDGIPNRYTN